MFEKFMRATNMQLTNGPLVVTIILAGLFAASAHAADQHGHEAHATDQDVLAPPEGRLWPTDAPLRTAMKRIQNAVEQATPTYQRNALTSAEAKTLAATVEESIAYMVANCRLAPEPDAALHVLIGRMMSAASSLQQDPSSRSGVPALISVLHDYQSTFDHAGEPHAHWRISERRDCLSA